MNTWNVIQKPAEMIEQCLLEAISSGLFAANSYQPVGRDGIPTYKEFA